MFGFNQFGAFNISGTRDAVLELMTLGGTTPNRFDSTTVTYNRQIGNRELSFAQDEVAFFVQDSWRIKPNLTVNAGLRWEGQYNPSPDVSNTGRLQRRERLQLPAGWAHGRPRGDSRRDQSVGSARRLRLRSVQQRQDGHPRPRRPLLRAHAVDRVRGADEQLPVCRRVTSRSPCRFAPPTGNPNDTVYEQFKLIGIDLNTYQLNNLPVLTPEQVQSIGTALGISPDPFLGAAVLTTDPEFRNPQGRQYGFGVEREVMTGLVVGAEFQQVKTKYLERNRNLNLPVPVIRATDPAQRPFWDLVNTPRPIASLGAITVRESTARSDFRALTLSSKYRTSAYRLNAILHAQQV